MKVVRFSAPMILAIVLANLAGVGQEIKIASNVQVSVSNQSSDHSEVIISADPSDPSHLLACSMIRTPQPSIADSESIAYISRDGGGSWLPTLRIKADLNSGDPSCVLGANGEAYFAALAFDSVERKYKGKTVLYRSTNGGATWSLAFTFPMEGDREFLTLDQENGRLYLAERQIGRSVKGQIEVPLVLNESSDAGKTFQTRATLSSSGEGILFGYPGGVLSDGTFVTGISEYPRSVSTGEAGTPVGKIRALVYNRHVRDDVAVYDVGDLNSCNPQRNSLPIPSLAVDQSKGVFAGRVYVSWPDSRSGRCEILLSTSSDGGKRWSKPVVVNDDQARLEKNSGPDDFHPVLAVNRQGVVGVFWYDRRYSQNNLSWQPRFSASLDGGQTFLPSSGFGNSGMKVFESETSQLESRRSGGGDPFWHTEGPINMTFGYFGHGITGGETAGLTADSTGAFHPIWIDNQDGIRQVWTSTVKVAGLVEKNGSSLLASLDDVSQSIAVVFSDVVLDRKSNTLTAKFYLQNTSNSELRAPLKVRVLRLVSGIGSPQFMNADNGEGKSGAVFDFTPLLTGKTLQPGQRTSGKQLTVSLHNSNIAPGDYDNISKILTIDLIVLGGSR